MIMDINLGYRKSDESDLPEGFDFKGERKLSDIFRKGQVLDILVKKVQVTEIRDGCVLVPTEEYLENMGKFQGFPFHMSAYPSPMHVKPRLTVVYWHNGKIQHKSFEGREIDFLMPDEGE